MASGESHSIAPKKGWMEFYPPKVTRLGGGWLLVQLTGISANGSVCTATTLKPPSRSYAVTEAVPSPKEITWICGSPPTV